MNKMVRVTRPVKRICKWILSSFKSNWSLNDYPIEYRQQEMRDLTGTNLTMYPWEARIINWYTMNGDGSTKKEAYLNLQKKFDEHKSAGGSCPRPGCKVKLTYASTSKMDRFENEAVRFFEVIFEMDYYGMFISDKSSMYDFCSSDEWLAEKKVKIKEQYGIEINDLEGLKIADILERCKQHN